MYYIHIEKVRNIQLDYPRSQNSLVSLGEIKNRTGKWKMQFNEMHNRKDLHSNNENELVMIIIAMTMTLK